MTPPLQALLGDVDSRLAAAGAPPMDARERAVAIKKLLVATATKGVDFALVRMQHVGRCGCGSMPH